MTMFTEKQRKVLHHRLSRELCWKAALGYQQDAIRTATVVLDELERCGFTAGTQRRAVERIVARMNETDPASSVSPTERDAQPVADATDVRAGSVS